MDTINFTTNWNNKLHCNYFTTIRIKSDKYRVGKVFRIVLTNKRIDPFTACVVKLIKVRIYDLPEITCYMDTGYSKDATIDILAKMYPDCYTTADFFLILLKKVAAPF